MDDDFFREELEALHRTLREFLPAVRAWLTSRGVAGLPGLPHAGA